MRDFREKGFMVRTMNTVVYYTKENGGGYITETWNNRTKEWDEVPGIETYLADVVSWVKCHYGWREAARLKKAIHAYCPE